MVQEFHGQVEIYDNEPGRPVTMDKLRILLAGSSGTIYVKKHSGEDIMNLNDKGEMTIYKDGSHRGYTYLSGAGIIMLRDEEGKLAFSVNSQTHDFAGMWLGGGADPTEGPKAGKVFIRDTEGHNSIVLDGSAGDIILSNSDCAEDFYISDLQNAEPGTVMVLEQEGMLRQSSIAYDKKVAGVISGAGDCKPGLVLDKRPSQSNRRPVALMGKVYCKVDAQTAAVEVGDLLTTSSTEGHAMKAQDASRAFGAVIGKALRTLKMGKGLIPILVTLQ